MAVQATNARTCRSLLSRGDGLAAPQSTFSHWTKVQLPIDALGANVTIHTREVPGRRALSNPSQTRLPFVWRASNARCQ
jgi:hypothetical protein